MDIDSVYQKVYDITETVNKLQENVNKSLAELAARHEILHMFHKDIDSTIHEIIQIANQISSKGSRLCSEGNEPRGLEYMRSADIMVDQSRRCQLILEQINKILNHNESRRCKQILDQIKEILNQK